jgi:ankyrin repeat protein
MKRYLEYINENWSDMKFNEQIKLYFKWFVAIDKNNIAEVKSLINQGVDVNVINEYYDSGLMIAALNGYVDIIKLLLDCKDIDVNLTNERYGSALIYTVANDSYEDNHEITIPLFLERPEIDITIRNNVSDKNLLEWIKYNEIDDTFLKEYDLQKKILNNGREDIILEFNKYDLVNDKIKEENPDLINASNWGLTS